ncbi:MAG: agmatinase [Chloroflexi bacterium]|nr:MAG: agmatinase [Chloroflexota bacterium]
MSASNQPADATQVARGSGIATFMGLPHTRDISGVDAAIVGIPSDTGGTPGSRSAPRVLRDVSSLLRPVHAHHNIAPGAHLRVVDYGDVPVIPGALLDTYAEMERVLAPFHAAGVVPIGIGGDHSVTLGELRAAARHHGPVALLQFDAHTDTYDEYYGGKIRYNSGTMFRRGVEEGVIDAQHSMMVGLRGTVYSTHDYQDARDLGFSTRTMDDIVELGLPQIVQDIRACVADRPLFLTFDVDSLDPSVAPGTGTLECGGLTMREAQTILRKLAGLHVVGCDVVEVNPPLDPTRTTAAAGATLVFEFLALLALARRGNDVARQPN